MSFDQYHELPDELSAKTRTFAPMITSMIEETKAKGNIVEHGDDAEEASEA